MKNNKKSKILVLGGSGFVGKNISEQLSSKYKLLYPTKSRLNLENEAGVVRFFKQNKIDVVIYCANIGGSRIFPDTIEMFLTNLRMFFNVARCSKYFKKMIFLGSGAEYNKKNSIINVTENDFDSSIPNDYYGFYKYICSKYIEGTSNIINLRIFGLFGKHEDYRARFISNIICQTFFNPTITINQNSLFDYVFIDDFIRILDHFISHKVKYKYYNIGSGKPIDLLSLADQVNLLLPKKRKIIIKKNGLGKEYTCSNTRLMKELRSFSFTPFTESLKLLYKYYAENKKLINKKELYQN